MSQYRQQTENAYRQTYSMGTQNPYGAYMYQMPTGYQQYPFSTQGGLQVPIPQSPPQTGPQVPGMLPLEQSYIENILRLNKGKVATVYMSFERAEGSNQKVFKGVIEAAGRDHIILSDPQTDMRYLLLMIYLDYITFDEEIQYSYPFNNISPFQQR